MRPFNIIVALDLENGIGKDGKLPWYLPTDLAHFKKITTQTKDPLKMNALIMGRKTWESIPDSFRPLPGRLNIVLTRNKDFFVPESVITKQSLEAALSALDEGDKKNKVETVFVVGGGNVYKEAIALDECQKIFATQILHRFHCDTFFPTLQAAAIVVRYACEASSTIT